MAGGQPGSSASSFNSSTSSVNAKSSRREQERSTEVFESSGTRNVGQSCDTVEGSSAVAQVQQEGSSMDAVPKARKEPANKWMAFGGEAADKSNTISIVDSIKNLNGEGKIQTKIPLIEFN
ncbi:uncharacterized protein LOC120114364 [Hibiscus syriacus]|uniref:uncharacterized protein LOC120114364 n=1 Tax=Hibiscus syriacus TaxID=106335 RepID=UPI001922F346|nr:uncharacterized protein LOC120114364 [Hibiscus syriacus]XP_038991230.1 uncharacterized protein LOC120114364 [Hibiscus syriacus]